MRAYRIDRVLSVDELDETFQPPVDVDAVAMLEDHLATGWEYQAEVLIEAAVATVARRLPRALGRLEAVDEARSRLVGSTSNPVWYAEQLAAVPAPYRIVKGPELQKAAREIGQRLLAAGSDHSDG
jgi:predicted DNA-binding transcriptional regulator YafY